MKIDLLIESIVECIRQRRRFGPKFPTAFDASYITVDNDAQRVNLELMENGRVVKYNLYLYQVETHGELDSEIESDGADDTERNGVTA